MSSNYGEGKYPGERPEKTLSRLVVYKSFQRLIGLKRFFEGQHVVLGGGGGDIVLLLSLGVEPKHIRVAENKRDVYLKLTKRFPFVPIYNGDVRDVVDSCKNLCTLNLDLCNSLTSKVVRLCTDTLSRLDGRSIATSITVYSSREKDLEVVRAKEEARGFMCLPKCARSFEDSLLKAFTLSTMLPSSLWAPRFIAYRSRGPALTGKHVSHGMAIVVGCTRPVFNVWGSEDIFVTSRSLQQAAEGLKRVQE